MITVDGKDYPTIEDAVKEFHVSAKTVYEWIESKIIDEPPTADQGLRTVKIFPRDYMKKAKKDVKRHKEGLRKGQKLNRNGQRVLRKTTRSRSKRSTRPQAP